MHDGGAGALSCATCVRNSRAMFALSWRRAAAGAAHQSGTTTPFAPISEASAELGGVCEGWADGACGWALRNLDLDEETVVVRLGSERPQ